MTSVTHIPEVWLRGPVHGIPPLLMPVAHALLQSREGVARWASGVSRERLWTRPNGAASAGFHLFHAAHALDRLMTYARGESLTEAQRRNLERERSGDLDGEAEELVRLVEATIDRSLRQLRCTRESSLLDERRVGLAGAPSTVLGLLFHAAEHTTRHTGQLITTLKIVAAKGSVAARSHRS
jgi:uncharacterized damage-inducible protein DinB